MKNKIRKETKCGLIATAVVILLGIIAIMSCTKIEQPELDGRPIKRPVNIVVTKD